MSTFFATTLHLYQRLLKVLSSNWKLQTKKMICPLCPRRFKEEISLKQHLMYHNEIAYCCPKCDKTFNSYSSMVYHQGKHNTPESRYCIRCNRNFTSPESFQKHIKLHGKSKPHLVPEKPSQTDKPKSEPKPFGCSICSRLRIWSENRVLLEELFVSIS